MGEESKIRTITIIGEPVPQGRPKFVRIGNRVATYDPPKSKKYKDIVKLYATAQLKRFDLITGEACVDITFYLPIPPSWPKYKRLDAEYGKIRPAKKPDIDNLYKGLIDALTGIAWKDDGLITDVAMRKRYTADQPRTEITIREVT